MEADEAEALRQLAQRKASTLYTNGVTLSLDVLLHKYVPDSIGRSAIHDHVTDMQRSYEQRLEEMARQQTLLKMELGMNRSRSMSVSGLQQFLSNTNRVQQLC